MPKGFDKRRLPGMLQSKRAWIENALARLECSEELVAPALFHLKAIDEQWQVRYQPARDGRMSLRDLTRGSLSVQGDPTDVYLVINLLKRWLSLKSHVHLAPWLRDISREKGLPFGKAIVRGQKTRWASCSRLQTISLNRSLLFLPKHLVRYVFLHELCHTKHLDHSPRFWDLLRRIEPDCDVLEAEVRQADHHVPRWARPR